MLGAGILFAASSIFVRAQTPQLPLISNTARAEWTQGGQPVSRDSNPVGIQVVPLPQIAPELDIFKFSGTNPTGQLPVPATMCRSNGGLQQIGLEGVFANIPTSPANIDTANSIRPNEPLIVQIESQSKNADPNVAEQFEVVLTTDEGDRENIILTETAVNSGLFVGLINTDATTNGAIQGDCALFVTAGQQLHFDVTAASDGEVQGEATVDILIDPFGISFDSSDGAAVDATEITLIDVATNAPAVVFGDDGVSSHPSSFITGQSVTDSSGRVYNYPAGNYRFPFVRPGTYRLLVTAPDPYSHPSTATPEQIALLTRPGGGSFIVNDASYGGTITLTDPAPVQIDIPLDYPTASLIVRKTTSTQNAAPGDVIQYRVQVSNPDPLRNSAEITITDNLPPALRIRLNSFRYNGEAIAPRVAPDGTSFSVIVPALAGGQSGVLTYLAEVRQDARPGNAVNLAVARDSRGTVSPTDGAAIRIVRDGISERFTIVGRIVAGDCKVHPDQATGIAGVRVIMEDGTYTVTDEDGRYHFEGIIPGTHVVQVDPESFPLDQAPVNCANNTRTAGSAISRFVDGIGGSVKRADFYSKTVPAREGRAAKVAPLPEALSDPDAAGTNRDWTTGQTAGIGFLFPETGYNPRTGATRVAIKHLPKQSVELTLNGQPVSPLSYDGLKKSGDGSVWVRVWRGLLIQDGTNILKARVLDENGSLVETLTREIYYSGPPVHAELVKEKSILLADGITRPRLAVRLTDRAGRPVQNGLVGDYSVPAPYEPAVDADTKQAKGLSGLERAKPVWRVIGDEGIAYLELQPTTASGTVSIEFKFQDEDLKIDQRIDTWLDPGDRPWTVVGFAAGTVGFNRLEQGLEELEGDDYPINLDGRIALYAKGRVSGKWLLTMSYDTDKKEDETRFAGTIDPRRYYTIYADRTDQRYDAASVRRLYLKLERPQFYALFGDYQTGINEPELARYQRSFNGVKAEYRNDQLHAQIFGSDTPYRYRRDEIQGNGLSGPYSLGSQTIIANSERITIETRDRLRSERIVDSRVLLRHIDYDIDYLAGTIIFKEPILSRGSGFDPQFIIAEYEVDGIGQRVANAGGRVKWQTKDGKFQIGATYVHDETDQSKTDLAGADIVYRPAPGTEIRAEIAGTEGENKVNPTADNGGVSTAWLVEAQHQSEKFDILAYARQQNSGFGVGQQNIGESGTRKVGVDARARLTPKLSVSVQAYQEDYLESDARRQAIGADVEYKDRNTTVRAGINHVNDELANGEVNKSTIAHLGASQKVLNGKLELTGQTEFAINSQNESVDFPARHQLGARLSVSDDVQLIGTYEIADGETVDARTVRVGFDVKPWAGARITASGNQQDIADFGNRTFAAYGLSQAFRISEKWSVDLSVDGNKTLGGIDSEDVQNPLHPVASGGFLSRNNNSLTEDFTAVTAGATYRGGRWSWTGRGEYRDGETTNRYGVTTAILRKIGEGRAVGGALSWFRATQAGGARTTTAEAEISGAIRPDDSRWSLFNKIEFHYDSVQNAVVGVPGPLGPGFNVSGDAKSRRIINSLSINYSPIDNNSGSFVESGEYSLFWGTRYVFDKFGDDEVKGWSNIIGVDARFDVDRVADIGFAATIRIGTGGDNIAYSGGPVITVTPFENGTISLGYNIVGFYDRDFVEARYTRTGPYITLKVKFDQESLAAFGL